MTDSEKRLLSIDLCGRLPYGVKVQCAGLSESMPNIWNLLGMPNAILCDIVVPNERRFSAVPIQDVKPYLRPMTSMTEEEKDTFQGFIYPACNNPVSMIDWLNAHHFDYRGLIEKGLALQAPEGMYNLA